MDLSVLKITSLLAQSDLDKVGTPDWSLMAFVCIVFAAIGYYCLQYGVVKSNAITTVGIVILIASGLLVAITQTPGLELYVFYTFAALFFSLSARFGLGLLFRFLFPLLLLFVSSSSSIILIGIG